MKNALHLELQISQSTPDRYYKQTSCNKSSHSKTQTAIISQEMHQIAIYKSTVEKDKVAQYILFKNQV